MDAHAWFILIYLCDDADSQLTLSTELRRLGHLVVETAQDNGDHFVIIETRGDTAALSVHELVMSIDHHAELVGTHDCAESKGVLTMFLDGSAHGRILERSIGAG